MGLVTLKRLPLAAIYDWKYRESFKTLKIPDGIRYYI
jgi:hypothetical protein